jgi:hypothetical protein
MFLYWIYTHHLLIFAIAFVAGLAAWRGGLAERWAAVANLCTALLYFGSKQLGFEGFEPATLLIDLALAVTFLVLTLRYASLWLGAAMLLEAGQFALHAFYFVTERPTDNLWATVNNGVSWGVVFCILAGVLASWRRRVVAARAVAPMTDITDAAA